jgi:uncharacterized membrane protein
MSALLVAVFFTTPAAALATAAGAAAVPVVIHFLNRRRFVVVDWAAMRFLQAAIKRTTRRLRLEQLLLLAVRTLLILLPVLAMAAATNWAESTWARLFPNAARGAAYAGQTHHVLILDGTLSMTARRDDGSAFERAQAMAAKLVRNAPGGDGFSLIVLGAPPKVIVPGPANDPARVVREIEELQCTHGLADVAQSLQFAEDALNRPSARYVRRVVYLFTDMQRTQWMAPTTPSGTWLEAWQRLHARADVAFVDVGGGASNNLAVTGLTLDDPFITAGSHVALSATIHNFGSEDRRQLGVELWQSKLGSGDDQASKSRIVRQELIDVAAGATATLAFPAEFRQAGEYRLEIRLPADVLAADDRRAIGVHVRQSLPVLLVNGRPASDPFVTATGWLAAALNPFQSNHNRPFKSKGSEKPVTQPSDVEGGSITPAQPYEIDANRFRDPDLQLDDYDCVFLCDFARPTVRDRERLDAYVNRGGTVIITLGPSCDPDSYQRALTGDGDGLLPARLTTRHRAVDGQFFTLAADDDAFRRPPLAAFVADDDRAALMAARFKEYWQVEPSPKATPRRILSFAPPATFGDALIYEWSRGRGRVVLITSTVNTDWSGWPISPSFPPFVQELVRSTARTLPRRDLVVGEAIDEYLPLTTTATEATVTPPDGTPIPVSLITVEDTPRLRFTDTKVSGLYSVHIKGQPDRVFAVNVSSGGESDLRRIEHSDLPPTGTGDEPQVVTDPSLVRHRPETIQESESPPIAPSNSAIGNSVARWLLVAGSLMLFVEPILAWRFGSARGPVSAIDQPANTSARRARNRAVAWLTVLPLMTIVIGAVVMLHAAVTGSLLAFFPANAREWIEHSLGVPTAAPGEGTRWRLDQLPVFTGDPTADRWLVGTVAVLALAAAGFIYWHELRRTSRLAGGPLVGLRWGLVLLALFVLLPQLRIIFEREGWPDLVVLIDDSQSMSVIDESADAVVKAPAVSGQPTRLELAKRLLAQNGQDWLSRLSGGKQARLHVYHVSDRLARLGEINDSRDIRTTDLEIGKLQATGSASRLGDAVRGVLQEFRGAALAGVVLLTDGITTDGDDLASAGRHASRAGVPLYLVGLGDAKEPKDIALTDLRVDDVIHVGDRLVFEAKVSAKGGITGNVAVTLFEKQGEQLIALGRKEIALDAAGAPVPVRLTHTPKEPGERVYVLSIPPLPGEVDQANNRLERTVTVDEFKRTRVLFIEGRPRYDFRFVKTLFERETEAIRGNKSIDLKVLLADADIDFSRQDRTAIEAFPSSKEDLFARFDAIILGDVAPDHPQLGEKRLQWLADFVKEKGGGLLFLAGPNAMPHAYRGTPLAGVLPVDSTSAKAGGTVNATGYRPVLTTIGRAHPALRFAPDEAENTEIWSRFKPFLWAATGMTPKPAAEVLATLPAEQGNGEPLVVQQFVGAGRVVYLGFEESWRWRFRADEPRFNQFWIQMVRYLARVRPSRAEIRLDRQTPYRRGEPIRLTVRFPEDKPPPPADAVVRVILDRTPTSGPAERQTLQLAAMPGARGTYETIVTRTPDGSYHFSLAGVEGRAPTADARVLPPPGEMDRLRMNRSDLERAAELSRGKFYTLPDALKLPEELPPLPRVTLHQPRPPYPLWNTPFVVLLGLSLLAGEWLLRKRQQLL